MWEEPQDGDVQFRAPPGSEEGPHAVRVNLPPPSSIQNLGEQVHSRERWGTWGLCEQR